MTKQTDIISYSVKLLNNKIYFINDLYKKLIIKYDVKDVNKTIKELIQKDYINDRKAASIYLKNLIEYKLYGKRYIYSFFERKNISKKLIDYLLKSYSDEIFIQNKQSLITELHKKNKTEKCINDFLLRKGYDIDEY